MDIKVINNDTYCLSIINNYIGCLNYFKLFVISFKFNDDAIKKIKRHNVDLKKPLVQNNPGFSRVQDAELMLMADPGLCLSMHQPYASLLLLNIKR